LRAAFVAPIGAPVLRDGAVVFSGNIVTAVGPAPDLSRAHPGATVRDYGDAVILPGLVNAHCHLELSHLSPPPNVRSFIDWLGTVMASSSQPPSTEDAVRAGVAESLRFGVTLVGDISREPQAARSVLSRSPLAAVSYGEVVGMAGRRGQLRSRLDLATDPAGTGQRLKAGISPHAPYSVDAHGYERCLFDARDGELPLTTHLAESPDEAAFLADHAGPFRALWDRIGEWSDPPRRFAGGPVRYAQSLGLLDYPLTLLAHVNYCDDDELEILAGGRASVVYCPRTHAYFRHPRHRWREMLAAGINVCVGTDSRASSPNLNLVDDLRLLHGLAPDVPPHMLWEMATVRAARAVGMRRGWGTLEPGKQADCVVFPAKTGDPLREVLENDALPLAVWTAGTIAAGAAAAG
jgi:cytosine/adenosine deaminase-related metal-dependent hydrolase